MKKFFGALLGLFLSAVPAQAQNNNYLADNGEFLSPFALTNSWPALQQFLGNINVKDTITFIGSVSGNSSVKQDASNGTLAIANSGTAFLTSGAVTNFDITQFGGYNLLTLNGVNTFAGGIGMAGGGSADPSLYVLAASAGNINFRSNNVQLAQINAGGGLTIGNPGALAGVLGISGSASGQFLLFANSTATFLNIGTGGTGVDSAGRYFSSTSFLSTNGNMSLNSTQTQANPSDLGDSLLFIGYSLQANTATNDLVIRVLRMSLNNQLTGGGHIQNLRGISFEANTATSTTTDVYDGIFFSTATNNGTTTTGHAINISSWPGTTKNTINDTSGGNWVNVGQLSLGAATVGSGTLNLNGSTSGTGVVFVNNVGNIGLQGVAGATFITAQGGTSGNLNLSGATSGTAVVAATATGGLTLQGVGGITTVLAQGGTSATLVLNGTTSGAGILTASATGGHLSLTGTSSPTLTAGCNGAGSSVSGNDINGTVTGQTAAATSCTLTFGTAYGAAPNCVAMGISSPLTGAATPATGTLVVNFASTANYKFTYLCPGV